MFNGLIHSLQKKLLCAAIKSFFHIILQLWGIKLSYLESILSDNQFFVILFTVMLFMY